MCEGRTCIITEKMMGANALLEKIIANAIGFLERERDPFSSLECLQKSSRIFFGSSFWYTSLCPSHLVWAWNEMTVKWELKRIFEKTTLEKKVRSMRNSAGRGKHHYLEERERWERRPERRMGVGGMTLAKIEARFCSRWATRDGRTREK
jgi:hypothetical protein